MLRNCLQYNFILIKLCLLRIDIVVAYLLSWISIACSKIDCKHWTYRPSWGNIISPIWPVMFIKRLQSKLGSLLACKNFTFQFLQFFDCWFDLIYDFSVPCNCLKLDFELSIRIAKDLESDLLPQIYWHLSSWEELRLVYECVVVCCVWNRSQNFETHRNYVIAYAESFRYSVV